MKKASRYILALMAVFIPTALVSFFTTSQLTTWYPTIIKPDFTPPSSLFAPVWTLLYVLMAIALARVWNMEASPARKKWLFAFIAQLLLNLISSGRYSFSRSTVFLPPQSRSSYSGSRWSCLRSARGKSIA